jgi:hypothetical protein
MPTFNKYNCNVCKYSTAKVGNYKSHCTSKAHLNKIGAQPEPEPVQVPEPAPMQLPISKTAPSLVCNCCNYTTIRTANMNRHCKTKTHLRAIDQQPKPPAPPVAAITESSTINALIQSIHDLTKSQKMSAESQKMSAESQKMSAESQKTNSIAITRLTEANLAMVSAPPTQMTNNGTINNITNKFNLNVFLKEDCKDAPNFSDFIHNIQVEMADLDETGSNTLESGIKQILGRALSNVHATNRPIHCTDQKRKTLYVKENGEWEKDAEHESLRRGVAVVRDKQVGSLHAWGQCHPSYDINGTNEQNAYLKMVRNSTMVLTPMEMSRIIGEVATRTNPRGGTVPPPAPLCPSGCADWGVILGADWGAVTGVGCVVC